NLAPEPSHSCKEIPDHCVGESCISGRSRAARQCAAFPAVLDTGTSHDFIAREEHLRDWAGVDPRQYRRVGTIALDTGSGATANLDLLPYNVWLYRNQPFERDQLFAPFCLHLGGVGCCPRGPEENGLIERANRTIREHLEGEELENLVQAQRVFARIIRPYNEQRLHSALGYRRPVDYYRGDPMIKHEARRLKLAQARHCRRERNLRLPQGTLPYAAERTVATT